MSFKTIQLVLPDVLICLNGILPDVSVLEKFATVPIIAADGAVTQLQEKGIIPRLIIGDLDSIAHNLSYWKNRTDIEIVHMSDQNSTDFEKVLEYVHQKGYLSPLICGLHGGELDHTLNNWSILMRYSKRMPLAVYDQGKTAIPIYESIYLETQPMEMISLIPQPTVHLTTDGLEWNLQNEELRLGTREGARNRAVKRHITLEIHSGSLLLFHNAHLPYIPQILG